MMLPMMCYNICKSWSKIWLNMPQSLARDARSSIRELKSKQQVISSYKQEKGALFCYRMIATMLLTLWSARLPVGWQQ